MRDKLIEIYDVNVQLIKGAGGIFEIKNDSNVLFSKHRFGRFPVNKDLEELNLNDDCND